MNSPVRLKDLINLEMLQKVQDNFSAAVGIALVTVDMHGVPVTSLSGFTEHCQAMRASKEGRARCIRSDDLGGRKAMARGGPGLFLCHGGLVDFAVPLVLRGTYLGAVLAGQVRLKDANGHRVERLDANPPAAPRDPRLEELFQQTPVISYKKIHSAAYTLYHLAGYLVEESYSKIMSQELNTKNLRLMEESRHRLELEKSLREAELQALSYQVNPHFLFNVLNAIGRLAYFERAEKTEKVVYGFSDMMRYILRKNISQFVSVRSEVEHVKNYLYIQQVRMSDKFSFSIEVNEKYNQVLCPFMVLQPIAENCVNYAVEARGEDGHIRLLAHDDGTDMILELIDNGDGIDPARAKAALEGSADRQGGTGIGLHNVDKRLKFFFGDQYGLEIVSSFLPGEGTTVRMRFPLHFDPGNL
ncbi:MAG: PocR ligand-binding domain-containing protein [Deltaproteobacteria bacterium]|jgi:ligand-binding sensor protein|nr:PocR ligand-binding domain-containing protein [Deltaproteobacteria bacterium]